MRIEETYKDRDVEEVIDIYFYRPLGYVLAIGAWKVGMTPNAVTVIGMIFGVLAGHLFFYNDPWINGIGVLCWMAGQALDGADGQLARMADMRSRIGRILDGFADNIKFFSVYLHLGLRVYFETGWWWMFGVMLAAGLCHSLQSAIADYYRNAYLFFAVVSKKSELDKSDKIQHAYAALDWRTNFIEKFLMRGYVTYTLCQERWAKSLLQLQRTALGRYGTNLPDWLKTGYRRLNRPLLKYFNALTTNTRMVVLYIVLFIPNIPLFFAFELIVLNLVLVITLYRQNRHNRVLEEEIECTRADPAPVLVA